MGEEEVVEMLEDFRLREEGMSKGKSPEEAKVYAKEEMEREAEAKVKVITPLRYLSLCISCPYTELFHHYYTTEHIWLSILQFVHIGKIEKRRYNWDQKENEKEKEEKEREEA